VPLRGSLLSQFWWFRRKIYREKQLSLSRNLSGFLASHTTKRIRYHRQGKKRGTFAKASSYLLTYKKHFILQHQTLNEITSQHLCEIG